MTWFARLAVGTLFLTGLGMAGPPAVRAETALPAVAADRAIVALVPPEIQKTGVLTVATDATYAPFESVDSATQEIVGFDADMARGIASLMGLKVQMVNSPFDNLIPALSSGKYNMAMSSIGDTEEREKVIDFVTYYWNSTSVLVPAGNPKKLGVDSLCGAKIGVVRGSLQQTTILPSLMARCGEKDPALIAGSVFKASTDGALALASDRIDGLLNDAVAVDAAAAQSDGKLQAVGPLMHNKSPGGVAIPKESGLQNAVLAAVKSLMASGYYAAALDRWQLKAIKIDDPVINWHKSGN